MTFVFKVLYLEDFKLYDALAGLLTCPRFEPPSRTDLSEQWQWVLSKRCIRTYSSGSVQDLHLFPSSSNMPNDISETNAVTKVDIFLGKQKKCCLKNRGNAFKYHKSIDYHIIIRTGFHQK